MPSATIGHCFACDRQGLPVYSVGAVVPAHACGSCFAKHGRGVLRDAMNRIVHDRTPKAKEFQRCRHCGGPVMARPDGGMPLLCEECVREWHAIGEAAAAAGTTEVV